LANTSEKREFKVVNDEIIAKTVIIIDMTDRPAPLPPPLSPFE